MVFSWPCISVLRKLGLFLRKCPPSLSLCCFVVAAVFVGSPFPGVLLWFWFGAATWEGPRRWSNVTCCLRCGGGRRKGEQGGKQTALVRDFGHLTGEDRLTSCSPLPQTDQGLHLGTFWPFTSCHLSSLPSSTHVGIKLSPPTCVAHPWHWKVLWSTEGRGSGLEEARRGSHPRGAVTPWAELSAVMSPHITGACPPHNQDLHCLEKNRTSRKGVTLPACVCFCFSVLFLKIISLCLSSFPPVPLAFPI